MPVKYWTQSVGALVTKYLDKCRLDPVSLLPACCAGNLPEQDVEGLGGGEAAAPVGVGQGDRVCRGHPELHVH